MSNRVMDGCLMRFGVILFGPKGEKFDLNIHETNFTIPESENYHNTLGVVMQSVWKIEEHVLRTAKVSIVKKVSK